MSPETNDLKKLRTSKLSQKVQEESHEATSVPHERQVICGNSIQSGIELSLCASRLSITPFMSTELGSYIWQTQLSCLQLPLYLLLLINLRTVSILVHKITSAVSSKEGKKKVSEVVA